MKSNNQKTARLAFATELGVPNFTFAITVSYFGEHLINNSAKFVCFSDLLL